MTCTRRQFALSTLASSVALRAADDGVRLIAHRGGVVGDEFAENSPASIQAAADRGYWMIEVDVRSTKDGRAIIQHDRDFERFYGNPGQVSEMTWREVKKLRAQPGGSRPILFEEALELCSDNLRIMLDIKERKAPASFHDEMFGALHRQGLPRPIYSLGGGGPLTPRLLDNGVMVSADRKRLKTAVSSREPVADRYFLFELGSVMDRETIAFATEHGVAPVAALNTFRYVQAGIDDHEGAKADAERLLSWGVREFQIDSIYDRYFPH